MAAVIGGAVAGAVATGVVNKVLAPKGGGMGPQDQASIELMGEQAGLAREQREFWNSNYKPLEQGLTADTMALGSPEDLERRANEAVTDVQAGYAGARRTMGDTMARRYIRTDSPAYVQALAGLQRGEAKDAAFGANAARQFGRDDAMSKQFQVAGLGRNLVSGANAGLNNAAAGLGIMGQTAFDRNRMVQADAREGLAPIAGAVGEWAGGAASNWLKNRNTTPAATGTHVNAVPKPY